MSQQRDLFTDPPATRATDPGTSYAAEKKITESGARRTIAQRVLACLLDHPDGLTYGEVADITGLRPDQVWRRMSDLKRMGAAVFTQETRHWNGNAQGIVRAVRASKGEGR